MMKVTRIIELVIAKAERGLWYDSDERLYDKKGWGLVIKIWASKMIYPMEKFWKKNQNVWNGDEPWFVIRGL